MGGLSSMLVRIAATLRPPREAEAAPSRRKILVIRVDDRVGNVLLTTPLISALRRLPKTEVHVLVAAGKARLIEGQADRIIRFEKRDFFRHPLRFCRGLMALSAEHYDVAIDASHWHDFSLTSALLLAWTRAPIRIAHARGDVARLASHTIPTPDRPEHDTRTKLRLLAPLDPTATWSLPRTDLGLAPTAVGEVRTWLESVGLQGRAVVGLVPGARKPDHRAPPELFVALAKALLESGRSPIVLWGPGEAGLAEAVSGASGVPMAPPTDLEALAALMRQCATLVTNDTGPMHLAVAVGRPTVGLFVKEDAVRWGYPDPPNAVVEVEGKPVEWVVEQVMRSLERSRPMDGDPS